MIPIGDFSWRMLDSKKSNRKIKEIVNDYFFNSTTTNNEKTKDVSLLDIFPLLKIKKKDLK